MLTPITKVFNARVIFYTSEHADVSEGFIDKADYGTIYIKAHGTEAPLFILGCEVLHSLRLYEMGRYDKLIRLLLHYRTGKPFERGGIISHSFLFQSGINLLCS